MNESVKGYLNKYPEEIVNLFNEIKNIIYDSISLNIEEKLWANIPSYYVGESFIRLIAFKDHINIEATKIINYKEQLNGYRITPKGMLQVFANQEAPANILKKIFFDTLINKIKV